MHFLHLSNAVAKGFETQRRICCGENYIRWGTRLAHNSECNCSWCFVLHEPHLLPGNHWFGNLVFCRLSLYICLHFCYTFCHITHALTCIFCESVSVCMNTYSSRDKGSLTLYRQDLISYGYHHYITLSTNQLTSIALKSTCLGDELHFTCTFHIFSLTFESSIWCILISYHYSVFYLLFFVMVVATVNVSLLIGFFFFFLLLQWWCWKVEGRGFLSSGI